MARSGWMILSIFVLSILMVIQEMPILIEATSSTNAPSEETTSGDDMIFSSADPLETTTMTKNTSPPVGGLVGVVAVVGCAVLCVCLWNF
ncbi:hypothetical protein SNE40_019647 [Patella caerulea]|uniref:Transmembrane protein n=1 Tax=Patella caerulea TaxID=87958 RepID=A0AAN8PG40_PATCE